MSTAISDTGDRSTQGWRLDDAPVSMLLAIGTVLAVLEGLQGLLRLHLAVIMLHGLKA